MPNIIHREEPELDTVLTIDDSGVIEVISPQVNKKILLPSIERKEHINSLLKEFFVPGGMFIFNHTYQIYRENKVNITTPPDQRRTNQERTVYTPSDFPIMVVGHETKGQIEYETASKTDDNSIKLIPRLKVLHAKEEFAGWITLNIKITKPEAEYSLFKWLEGKNNLNDLGQKELRMALAAQFFQKTATFVEDDEKLSSVIKTKTPDSV